MTRHNHTIGRVEAKEVDVRDIPISLDNTRVNPIIRVIEYRYVFILISFGLSFKRSHVSFDSNRSSLFSTPDENSNLGSFRLLARLFSKVRPKSPTVSRFFKGVKFCALFFIQCKPER